MTQSRVRARLNREIGIRLKRSLNDQGALNGSIESALPTPQRFLRALHFLESLSVTDTPSNESGELEEYYERFLFPFFEALPISKAIQTGKGQWGLVFRSEDTSPFSYFESHPEEMKLFFQHMNNLTHAELAHLKEGLPLRADSTLLDLGGGCGSLASGLLKAGRINRVTVLEPIRSIQLFRELNLLAQDSRIEFQGGSFFDLRLSARFDQVLLSWILHDWDDEDCVRILRTANRLLSPSGRLFILEGLLPEDRSGPLSFLDVVVLLHCGGRERTLDDYTRLITRAGLRFEKVIRTAGSRHILCCAKGVDG